MGFKDILKQITSDSSETGARVRKNKQRNKDAGPKKIVARRGDKPAAKAKASKGWSKE